MLSKLLGIFIAVILIVAGLFIPIHFGAISNAILYQAGQGTVQVDDLARSYQLREANSVVELLGGYSLQSEDKTIRLLGGHDFLLEAFFKTHPELVEKIDEEENLKASKLFIDKDFSETIISFLGKSPQKTVQSILSLRDLTTWQTFPPAYSSGGQPLRSTLALLGVGEQSGHLSDGLSLELSELIMHALSGDQNAVRQIENGFLTIVSLQRRLTYAQLTAVLPLCQSWDDLANFNDKILQSDIPTSLWFSTILFAQDWGSLIRYAHTLDEDKVESSWHLANIYGRGAIVWLLDQEFVIYAPPYLLAWMEEFYEPLTNSGLFQWFLDYPSLSISLKFFFVLLGGFCFSIFFFRGNAQVSSLIKLTLHGSVAAVLAVTILLSAEPRLLEARDQQSNQLTLNFGTLSPLESLESHMINLENLDPVTLFVLALFFLVQFVIYVIGLMKVVEIRAKSVSPELKIKLLENEDQLFDFGLYVGLGGTVTSLIMLAMGIVEASLVAAYASTLFGIIFVAILKIVHVRPLKNKLILESQ